MKLGRTIPYGWPVIISALILSLTFLSLSPETNPGYGYEFLAGSIGKKIVIIGSISLAIAAIIFFINSIFVDKQLEKIEKERELKAKLEKIQAENLQAQQDIQYNNLRKDRNEY